MTIEEAHQKTPCCPICKSHNYVIPIIYGKPTKELLEQWKKKEIELGGSLTINSTRPQWTCTRCKIFVHA